MSEAPEEVAVRSFGADGLEPYRWSNSPGFRYGEHEHPYHKVLFCTHGSIVFHTPDGDFSLKHAPLRHGRP